MNLIKILFYRDNVTVLERKKNTDAQTEANKLLQSGYQQVSPNEFVLNKEDGSVVKAVMQSFTKKEAKALGKNFRLVLHKGNV